MLKIFTNKNKKAGKIPAFFIIKSNIQLLNFFDNDRSVLSAKSK